MTFSEALSTAEDAGKLGGAPMLIDKNSGSADFADSLSGGVFDYQPINLKEFQ